MRVNRFKDEVGRRLEGSAETRKKATSELLLISVDLVVIISVMLLINLLSTMSDWFRGPAEMLHVLPVLILFLAGLIIITPAVFNTMMSIRRMAAILVHGTPEHAGKGKHSPLYRLVSNIGDLFLAGTLVVLFAPFVAMFGAEMYSTLVFVLMTWLVILFLIWNSYKRVYDRVRTRIKMDMVSMEAEEGTRNT